MAQRIIIIFLIYASIYCPSIAFSQETAGGHTFIIKYLYTIKAAASGERIGNIDSLFVSKKHEELYILDSEKKLVLITDLKGAFLYQFKYTGAGVPIGIVATEDGLVYIANEQKVAVFNYRGVYQKDLDVSTIPDKDKMVIQSFAVDGDKIYIGDNAHSRIVVMDRKKETYITQFKEGLGKNIYLGMDDAGIYVRDPATFSVYRLDKSGKPLGSFGTVSSLPGGFSMTVDINVDRKNGRVIVVEANRAAIIFFDREGKFLFEFGGPEVLKWPRAVAVDDNNRVYVSDSSQTVRVFEIIEEAPVVTATTGPPAESELQKDEVTKIVEKESRLLPIFFAVNSSELNKSDIETLDKNVVWLLKNPHVKINVRGYADERGSDEYHFNLSEKRARSAMDYFEKNGIDPKRMKFVGFGRVASTDYISEETMRQNRRVDFLVTEGDVNSLPAITPQ